MLCELARSVLSDVENGQPAELLIVQGAGREQVTALAQISKVCQVSVLQGASRFVVKLWRVPTQDQQCDRKVVKFH